MKNIIVGPGPTSSKKIVRGGSGKGNGSGGGSGLIKTPADPPKTTKGGY